MMERMRSNGQVARPDDGTIPHGIGRQAAAPSGFAQMQRSLDRAAGREELPKDALAALNNTRRDGDSAIGGVPVVVEGLIANGPGHGQGTGAR
jgi:hypothetical protein